MMKRKNKFGALSVFLLSVCIGYSQAPLGFSNPIQGQQLNAQKIAIVISSNDPETVWNAFRLANYSVEQGDSVSVFLLGKGVESPGIVSQDFDIKEMMETFSNNNGRILACGTCLQLRDTEGSKLCPVSSLSDLYAIMKTSEILLTF